MLIVAVIWGRQISKPFRYHRKVSADLVLKIDVLRNPTASEYGTVSAGDQQAVIAWFNEARFIGDNDDLAGPGCSLIGMSIYLKSGGRVTVSEVGQDRLEVGQNEKHYFIEHPQLKAFLSSQKSKGGC